MSTLSEPMQARLLLCLWALIVGLSFIAVAWITPGLSPMLLTTLRFLIAAGVLFPLVRKSPYFLPQNKQTWQAYCMLGMCLAGFFAAQFIAGILASPVNLSFLYLLVPLLTLFLGVLFSVEKWSWKIFGLLVIGTIGTFLVIRAGQSPAFDPLSFGEGEIIFLAGCVMMSLYPVLSKRYVSRQIVSPIPLVTTFWSLTVGGVTIGIIGTLIEPSAWVDLFEKASVSDYMWILYLAILSSALTFYLMQKATLALMPTQITAYNFLIPFVAIGIGVYQQTVSFSLAYLPGLALVLLSVILLNWPDKVSDHSIKNGDRELSDK